MKKNLTKKLMLSVLTLAFAVVSLGASTFAWFTMSGTATVGTFEGSVIGGTGLDIAITEVGGYSTTTKWYSNGIPNAVVQNVIDTYNGPDWEFNAVTPTNWQQNEFNTQNNVLNDKSESAKGQYVVFDLHFKLTDPNAVETQFVLYLNQLVVKNTSTINAWTVDAGYKYGTAETDKFAAGDDAKYNILSATRVSFNTVVSNTNEKTAATLSSVYEQAAVAHNVSSKTITEGETTIEAKSGVMGNTTGWVSEGALDYYNSKMAATEKIPAESNRYTAATLPYDTTQNSFGNDAAIEVGKLQSNGMLTVTVAVWVEGWDAECLNAIFSQALAVDMIFELVDPTKA